MSIEHIGVIENGKEDTSSEATRSWAGAQENYTFRSIDGATEILVEMDSTPENEETFEKTWPRALLELKALAEKE